MAALNVWLYSGITKTNASDLAAIALQSIVC